MSIETKPVLIYGIGNPSRGDDALGICFIETLSRKRVRGARFECGYQVNAEDAFEVSQSSAVIFVDASMRAKSPYTFTRLLPDNHIEYSTHAMEPASVLALSASLFSTLVPGFMLGLKGVAWDLGKPLSEQGCMSLKAGLEFFNNNLKGLIASQNLKALDLLPSAVVNQQFNKQPPTRCRLGNCGPLFLMSFTMPFPPLPREPLLRMQSWSLNLWREKSSAINVNK